MKTTEVILLLSGGIDSTTMLAQLTGEGKEVHALSFDYGQRHAVELEYAKRNAAHYQVATHHVIKIDYGPMAEGNILTGREAEVNTVYVPGRNLMMLSSAAAYAEAKAIGDIYFAANADDGQRFPDCSQAFVSALNELWQSCSNTKGVKVHVPLIHLTKVDVIEKALALEVGLQNTMSCYTPSGQQACGQCLSCTLRKEAIKNLKIKSNNVSNEERI